MHGLHGLCFQGVFVPVKEFLDALLDFDAMSPSEGVELGDVDEFAHGAIGLGGIEFDGAFEAYGFDDEFGEFADGEFLAGAYIDVAVAYLAKTGDVTTTACAVVSIYCAIGGGTEMDGAVFLNTDDVAEVDIEQYVDGGIGHVLGPQELTKGLAGAPEDNTVVGDAVLGENIKGFLSIIKNLRIREFFLRRTRIARIARIFLRRTWITRIARIFFRVKNLRIREFNIRVISEICVR